MTRPSGPRRLPPRPSSGSRWPRNAGMCIPRRGLGGARAHRAAAGRARLVAQGQALVFSITEDRIEKWMCEITEALRSGRLAPSRASKLAGKLSWGGSAVFGRGCRCYLAPLYRHAHQKSWRLEARARAALQWWARFLPGAPRKVIPLGPAAPRPRIILYSDATGRGRRARARARGGDRTGMRRRLAWAADAPDGRYFAAADISKGLGRWVKPRRTQAGGVHRARARRLLGEGAASAGGRVGASCRGLHAAIRVPAVAGGGAPVLR